MLLFFLSLAAVGVMFYTEMSQWGKKLSGSEEFVPEEGVKQMQSTIPKAGILREKCLIWISLKNSNTENFLFFFKMISFKFVQERLIRFMRPWEKIKRQILDQ